MTLDDLKPGTTFGFSDDPNVYLVVTRTPEEYGVWWSVRPIDNLLKWPRSDAVEFINMNMEPRTPTPETITQWVRHLAAKHKEKTDAKTAA